jgi:hypothetical protein
MHRQYIHQWMELLAGRLEPGERVLARGRAFAPDGALGLDLSTVIGGPESAVLVTERRVLWVGREDRRWIRSLPFALVASHTELTQAHRYALALEHQPIGRRQWVPSDRSPVPCWPSAAATPGRRPRSGSDWRRLVFQPGSRARCPSAHGPVRDRRSCEPTEGPSSSRASREPGAGGCQGEPHHLDPGSRWPGPCRCRALGDLPARG